LRLVRVLSRAHARATFFEVGSRVGFWTAGARSASRIGELGNHTWSHANLSALSTPAARRELTSTQRAIGRTVGSVPRLFRPPYAEARPVDDVLGRELGLLDVRWSVDGADARVGANPAATVRAVVRGLRPGAIVLLHDLHPWTPQVAAAVLRAAKKRGLRAVTVSELLARQPPSGRQLGSQGAARCPTK